MKDGTILLFKPEGKPNLLQRIIQDVTKSEYTHAAIYCEGCIYEADWPKVKVHVTPPQEPDLLLEPETPLSDIEKKRMWNYLENAYAEEWEYNIPKLVILWIVYPLRKLFSWLKWMPFDKWIYGEICSGLVQEAWRATHRMDPENWTAPGDFILWEGFQAR